MFGRPQFKKLVGIPYRAVEPELRSTRLLAKGHPHGRVTGVYHDVTFATDGGEH